MSGTLFSVASHEAQIQKKRKQGEINTILPRGWMSVVGDDNQQEQRLGRGHESNRFTKPLNGSMRSQLDHQKHWSCLHEPAPWVCIIAIQRCQMGHVKASYQRLKIIA